VASRAAAVAAGADPKEAGLGSCIDCHLCVQVCPTGIDIRDGLQYECIGCAACIDVCDDVMDKMGYPRGLVRYTTENALEGKPSRVLRPRILIAYGALIAIVSTVVLTTLIGRTPLIVDVMRDRNALFREVPGGLIENVYTLRIQNMDDDAHAYVITASGTRRRCRWRRRKGRCDVAAGEVRTVVARLQAPYTIRSSGSTDVDDRSRAPSMRSAYTARRGRPASSGRDAQGGFRTHACVPTPSPGTASSGRGFIICAAGWSTVVGLHAITIWLAVTNPDAIVRAALPGGKARPISRRARCAAAYAGAEAADTASSARPPAVDGAGGAGE
jgi:ferredoxin